MIKKYKKRLLILLPVLIFLCFFTGNTFALENTSVTSFLYPEYSKTISMDFKEAELNDVLKIFSQQSGLNFIAAENIADKKISLFLDKVPVEEALEKILSANSLTYEIQPDSNIFIVKPLVKPEKDLLTRVYYLKYATVSSSKLNSTVKIDPDVKANSSSSSNNSSTSSGSTQNTVNTTIGISAAIKAILSKDGSVIEDPRTNSITVTDVEIQFPIIEQTIARLDVPTPLILIETEMLDISKDAAEQLGIKIGDTPLTFKGAERDVVYPWNQNALLRKGYTFADAEYRVGTISAAGLTAALQFLKTQSDTKTLARPRIMTLSNEMAQINISTNEAIGTENKTTGATNSTTLTTGAAERVPTGVFLTVTPQVNLATHEITMAIYPRVIQAKTGGTFDGKTFKDTEERGSKSILRVDDGETIILGGLLRSDTSKTVTKMPILGDIPIVGAAFRHKDTEEKERELVIFLTPHIVTDSAGKGIALKAPEKLTREQELPPSRSKEIDKALSSIEKQRR